MSFLRIAVASLAGLLPCGSAVAQTTWHVDDDNCPGPGSGTQADPFCSIQVAIDASADGDVILVEPGYYVEILNFFGKAVCLQSTSGYAVTTIDGGGIAQVVTFASGETSASVLDGFTIFNAVAGIVCSATSPTIRRNLITGHARHGIVCGDGATPCIEFNVITGNTNHEDCGWCGGAGVMASASSPLILFNVITENTAHSVGAGIYCYYGSSPLIAFNVIANNTAYDATYGRGGGVGSRLNGTAPVLVNNTLYGNTAGLTGGAVYTQQGSATLLNTIAWGNFPDELSGSQIAATYSDIQGGYPGVGNIDADPMFADPAAGDFHLLPGSPCVDAGDPASPTDCDGSVADIGALPLLGEQDCNDNGVLDCEEITADPSGDCDGDQTLDSCEIEADPGLDLNRNGVLDECECFVTGYCIANPNSTNLPGRIGAIGIPSISLNSFTLGATQLPPSQFGIFFLGPLQIAPFPFGDGYRCVGGQLTRLDPPVQIDGQGLALLALDFTRPPLDGFVAGDTTNIQFWYRDPQGVGVGFNLTDALEVTFCP